jgi:hypothetical protein
MPAIETGCAVVSTREKKTAGLVIEGSLEFNSGIP